MTERLVRFARRSDAPPPEREELDVADDGSATAWRSTGPAVGRFAGPAADVAGLRAAVDAARGQPAPEPEDLAADASVETVEIDGASVRVAAGLPVDGPWGGLVDACRAALDAVREHPVAAIALVLDPDGSARLEHRGSEPLPVELASLAGRVRRWHAGAPAADARLAGEPADRVEAGPGWSMDLAPEGFEPGDGIVTAEVTFVADDDGVYVPVRLTASLGG